MELRDYQWKWQAIGKQLLTLMTDEDFDRIDPLIEDLKAWLVASQAEWDAAADWLALPPSRLVQKWAKVPSQDRPVLMLRLQFLCCQSAKAAGAAEIFERLRGKDSRQDLADAARSLHSQPLTPTARDMRDAIYG